MRVGCRFVQFPGALPVLAIATACLLEFSLPPGARAQEKAPPAARKAKPAAAKPAATKRPAAVAPAVSVPSAYEVAKGDTLFRIAGRTRHQGATLNQTVLALYKANPDAFLEGNINQLLVGRTLTVPGREAVMAVDPAEATRQLRVLIAKPLVPVPPPAPPAPPVKEAVPPKPAPPPPPKPAARPSVSMTPQQAEERFEEGRKLERSGDLRAAMQAYVAAGEAGHGLAQKRLGDIYNTGNAVVTRDYGTALLWYQKARAQGVEIPKPFTNPGGKYN